jgi:hypothetical protein
MKIPMVEKPPNRSAKGKLEREERLAMALRANLKRRKSAARQSVPSATGKDRSAPPEPDKAS